MLVFLTSVEVQTWALSIFVQSIIMEAKVEQLNYYFSQLNTNEQDSVLQLLETIAKGKSDSSGRISIEQYNTEIDEALAEVERGETLSHEEGVTLSKSW